ncbi:proto-oncogene tyrosine-protein kinase receptor Ret-like [Hydra vulgaris]|uniref:Proto-oncogene tyrosine-protein kinase receptor Ret-like n=1 Tax=Hydra vulgaris TaxID=6087 RepID=A0ABM4CS16_HYDVU
MNPLLNSNKKTEHEIYTKPKLILTKNIEFKRSPNCTIYLISVNASLEDIDECNYTSQCPWSNAECQNTFGGYLCKCKKGWVLSEDNASCVDYNECTGLTAPCSLSNQECLNSNGSYLCKCKSGWTFELNSGCIDPAPYTSTNTVAIIVSVLICFVILAVIAAFFIHRKKFMFQPNIDPDQWEKYMNYEKSSTDKWEIFPKSIIFGKKIGEGEFGNVFMAKICLNLLAKTSYANQFEENFCDIKIDSTINVAVKLLKDGANEAEVKDFLEEINLMKGVGYHKNIVNMIGCCTLKKYLCLVNEYMENGDLLQFLRSKRAKLISSNDGIESQVKFINADTNSKSLEKTTLMHNEIPLMDIEAFDSSDLLSFAWQIASGMEYLSCMKLVHRDLAARNILVGAHKNVKISDFGLTRKLYNDNYRGIKNRCLPIKWMSVEAIFYRIFSSSSDVWAFGVVLFEILTLGGIPYSTISNRDLLVLLKSGYRMERPENCSQYMYDIMLDCWNEDPLKRPTFTELRELFENIISQGNHYVSLDINENSCCYKSHSFHRMTLDISDDLQEEELLKKPKEISI